MTTSFKNQLTPGELFRFKEVFMQFDFQGDGTIATKDLGAALKFFGINLTGPEIGNLLDEVDINRKGPIEFDEFINLVTMKNQKPLPQEDTSNEE